MPPPPRSCAFLAGARPSTRVTCTKIADVKPTELDRVKSVVDRSFATWENNGQRHRAHLRLPAAALALPNGSQRHFRAKILVRRHSTGPRTSGVALPSALVPVTRTPQHKSPSNAFFWYHGRCACCKRKRRRAGVAELADAPDLGSGGETREGSSPFARTILQLLKGQTTRRTFLFHPSAPGVQPSPRTSCVDIVRLSFLAV